MISPNVNKILEAAQALNEAERRALRRLLDERSACEPAQTDEEALDQLLRGRGITRTVAPKPTPQAVTRFRAWRPIEMPRGITVG